VLLCIAGIAGVATGQHVVDLTVPNSIPTYCEESPIWGGPATAKMALEGYPSGVDYVHTQAHIWNVIQTYLDDPGVPWATDPDGMEDALEQLDYPSTAGWVIVAKPNPNEVLYTVTRWMTRYRYPTPALINGFQKWVLITGFETDLDPTVNSTVNLRWIKVKYPHSVGAFGCVEGIIFSQDWFNSFWNTPGYYPASKWHGNYIAVAEPPEPGEVWPTGPELPWEGDPISPGEAIDRAYEWLDTYELRSTYRAFANTTHLEPLLVDPNWHGYYVVPFGYEESDITHGAVLVNAYNGAFMEIGTFSRPGRLLRREDAERHALNYLRCDCEAEVLDARLTYQPSILSCTPLLPIWEFHILHPDLEDSRLYVNMAGIVARRLVFLPLGH
jgi:hypothetical protein